MITEIAEALVGLLGDIGLNADLWEKKEIRPPAGSVWVPTLQRTEPDEAESQLGTDDWRLIYPVSLYFDLANVKDQQTAVEKLEAFVKALDADPSLGGTVLEASVTEAVLFKELDRPRPLVGYEITVSVLRLVSNP